MGLIRKLTQRERGIAKFTTDKAFRRKVVAAAVADGKLQKGIDPDNLNALLQFLIELLPYILKLFV